MPMNLPERKDWEGKKKELREKLRVDLTVFVVMTIFIFASVFMSTFLGMLVMVEMKNLFEGLVAGIWVYVSGIPAQRQFSERLRKWLTV